MPTLPVELYRPIVAHVDDRDLLLLLTTCRLMHAESERILYRHIGLYARSTQIIDELIHCPRRCLHVRSLFMYETGGKILWTKLSVAFSMMHNLIEADFDMCTPQIRLQKVFGHGTVKFRKLKCTFDYDQDLLDFFTSQDQITQLAWNGYLTIPPQYSDSESGSGSDTDSSEGVEDIQPPPPFPSHVFPRLTHLLGPMENINLLYPGRNITHLSLYGPQGVDLNVFYCPRSPNLRLRALSMYNTLDRTEMHDVVSGCPNLRFLSCIITLEVSALLASVFRSLRYTFRISAFSPNRSAS